MTTLDITKLPTLPENYFWMVGSEEGRTPETSGIRREYGFMWIPMFGVSIYRRRQFMKIFKWVEPVTHSWFPVMHDQRDVQRAAKVVLDHWKSSIK